MIWLAVALAGGAGAVCRYLVDTIVSARTSTRTPYGTLAVNLSGSFLLGALGGVSARQGPSPSLDLVLGGGFLGAYTTFSTFAYETVRLLEDGELRRAGANLASTLVGVAAAAAGYGLTGW